MYLRCFYNIIHILVYVFIIAWILFVCKVSVTIDQIVCALQFACIVKTRV